MAFLLSEVAWTVPVPAVVDAVKRPVESMVPIPPVTDQPKVDPGMGFPNRSWAAAANCRLSPAATSTTVGEMDTCSNAPGWTVTVTLSVNVERRTSRLSTPAVGPAKYTTSSRDGVNGKTVPRPLTEVQVNTPPTVLSYTSKAVASN